MPSSLIPYKAVIDNPPNILPARVVQLPHYKADLQQRLRRSQRFVHLTAYCHPGSVAVGGMRAKASTAL